MKMIIIELTAKQKIAFESLQHAHARREEALQSAEAANDLYLKTITETDLDDYIDIHERVDAEETLWKAEIDADVNWKRYKKACLRYLHEQAECRKLGIIE